MYVDSFLLFFFFQAEDGIRDYKVTGVQTCALPISLNTVLSRDPRELRAVQDDGYDFLTSYHYNFLHSRRSHVPFADLVDSSAVVWRHLMRQNGLPFVPSAASGWDPRPWRGWDTTSWYSPWTVQDADHLGGTLHDLVPQCDSAPSIRCIALLYAWRVPPRWSAS